jgi:hypothetical protein
MQQSINRAEFIDLIADAMTTSTSNINLSNMDECSQAEARRIAAGIMSAIIEEISFAPHGPCIAWHVDRGWEGVNLPTYLHDFYVRLPDMGEAS